LKAAAAPRPTAPGLRRPSSGNRLAPLAAFFLSLLVTGLLCASVWRSIENQDRARFDGEVARTVTGIRERVETVVALLDGTAGLFAASQLVEVHEFDAFVQRLQLAERYPGILGIGYSQRIAPADLPAVQSYYGGQYGSVLGGAFHVWPVGPRAEYHSIVMLQPMDERNRAAIGYDMFSEPTRRAAMAAARDSGAARASAKVTLVQEIEPQKQAGFLIYLAVYADRAVPADVAARRAQLLGFVYAPLRVDDLLRGARGGASQVDYALYDGIEARPAQLLRSTATGPVAEPPRFSAERDIEVAGRPWRIDFRTGPGFESLSQHRLRPGLVLMSVATSALLALIVFAQGRARQVAELTGRSQRDAAEALHQEHSWLRSTLAGIADAVVAVDAGGRIVFVNPEAGRLTGWAPDETRGLPLETVVRLQLRAAPAHEAAAHFGDPAWSPFTLLARDGRQVPVERSAVTVRTRAGMENGAVIVLRDATERMRQEQALRAGEQRERERSQGLQRLVEATPALAGTTREEALAGVISAAARRLLGASTAAMPARAELPDEAASDGGLTVPLPTVRAGEHVLHVGPRPDRPYSDDDRLLLEQLAAIAGIALRNSRLYAELRDADRRKDEFLATLAHELRNPLAPIRTSLEIARRAPAAPAAQRALEVAERQTRHMVRLIDDLLDVSRISRGTISLRNEPVQLAAVLGAAVESSRPLIDARRHHLDVAPADAALVILGDATRLAQVFSNLLNNAALYTEPGGHVRVDVEARGRHVDVAVVDDGIGITSETLGRLFEPFTRGEHPAGVGAGLGIGLSLVRTLVELHGGSVHAESEGPGRGARFVVCLPLMDAPVPAASDPATAAPAASGAALDVLVVDDNVDAAESLAVMLESDGHHVRLAHDGEGAVAEAQRRSPDVALLDIGLPGFDGYEVARRLRAMPGGERLRLVAITGWGQPEDRRRASAAGFDVHMVKPVDYATLAGHLRRFAKEFTI
jgi:PAS domain S-box-containing protein